MGELRDRIERDMRVRDFSVRTIEAYVAAVSPLILALRRASAQPGQPPAACSVRSNSDKSPTATSNKTTRRGTAVLSGSVRGGLSAIRQ